MSEQSVERRFSQSYRAMDSDEAGLVQRDDGVVFVVFPDGTRAVVVTVTPADLDWHVVGEDGPPFLNGFENAPGDWASCRYRFNLNSTIYIDGVVARADPLTPADAPTPIFQLPDEAMPGGDLIYVVPSNSRGTPGDLGASFILIQADGTVCWNGYVGGTGEGASDALSVCVSFSMEQAILPPL